ncbi:extensin-like domain-containing protein [Caulobacter sp. Root487D2Y]|uniref:extensin-like domain-containing protein n=1 Tax=Caulobacter sp. Root487D2Y TaxID=1736547 RepID=UPI000AE9ADDD|nr:extensin family protein [Caulobacter sp. Root487D2Y]
MKLVLRETSPEARSLASAAGFLLDLLLAGLLVFALVDRLAPPQDLPWKPFSLNQPIGLATAGKLARIGADPAACRAALREGGVRFAEGETRETGYCSTRDTVRAAGRLAPAAPVMTCPLALGYALWEHQVLVPASREIMGSRLVRVEHYGTYACRTIYGRPGERPSAHAHAAALDVAGFRFADGRRGTVAADFRSGSDEGHFVQAARNGACRVFGTVLSPDYNAAHRDHLHLEGGGYRLCR